MGLSLFARPMLRPLSATALPVLAKSVKMVAGFSASGPPGDEFMGWGDCKPSIPGIMLADDWKDAKTLGTRPA